MGAGRLGISLALAAREQGATIAGYLCRTEKGAARAADRLGGKSGQAPLSSLAELADTEAEVYALTVPDTQLSRVAEEVCAALSRTPNSRRETAPIIMHTSGATPLSVLTPCSRQGLHTLAWHPLQTFSDPDTGKDRFQDSSLAITGSSQRAEEMGYRMALALGARPFPLEDENRTLYHAAAVMAGNYLVTLLDAAAHMFRLAGLPEDLALPALMPLAQGALQNTREYGPTRALTGPLARGDQRTIEEHLQALSQQAPDYEALYRALGLHTLPLALSQGGLERQAEEELRKLLTG